MLETIKLPSILFLDVETVCGKADFDELSESTQELWTKKSEQINRREDEQPDPKDSYTERAAIYAEFGKIVCISVGYISPEKDGDMSFRLKSYCSEENCLTIRRVLSTSAVTISRSLTSRTSVVE